MENRNLIKIISGLVGILVITSCGTPPKKPVPANETIEGSQVEQPFDYADIPEDYVLPNENVLAYKKYTMEELMRQSPTGGGLLDNDLVPIAIDIPFYPASAFKNGEQGDVLVEFTAPTTGKIQQIKVISSPANPDFEKSALASLQNWRYSPPKVKNTKYTVTNVPIKIEYRIENGVPVGYFKDETNSTASYPPGPIPLKVK